MRRLRRLLIVVTAALAMVAGAAAAAAPAPSLRTGTHARTDAWNLHPGSHGPRVAGLQWLLSGHCPNKYSTRCGGQVKPTLHRYTPLVYGPRTKHGLLADRYRLGFPAKGECGAKASKLTTDVTPWFFALLEGKVKRPVCWVALAADRIKLAEPGQPTKLALAIRRWELAQVGTREQCGGYCNRGWIAGPGGWSVDAMQRHFGLLGVAWCEVFQELGFEKGGYHPIPFSPYPFAVIPSYRSWAAHNLANAKLRVGSLMVFLGDAGHIGYVITIHADSAGRVRSYDTVEGNTSDGVYVRHYPWISDRLRVFVNLPGVA